MLNFIQKNVWELLRFSLGFIFLWTFFDKVFGLGFSTTPDKAWILGNSPTIGFLKFGTSGPFGSFFQSLAGNTIIDWLFMLGMLLTGLALIFGIGIRIASYAGATMMFLIWLSVLPPEHNPIIDEHIIYILVLIGLKEKAGYKWGLRGKWSKTPIVKKYKILE